MIALIASGTILEKDSGLVSISLVCGIDPLKLFTAVGVNYTPGRKMECWFFKGLSVKTGDPCFLSLAGKAQFNC